MHWANTCPYILNYVGNVAEPLSETEDESGCDDEVNII